MPPRVSPGNSLSVNLTNIEVDVIADTLRNEGINQSVAVKRTYRRANLQIEF